MIKRLPWLALLALALPLAAADPKAQKVYDGIMSDSDIYAGEGVVTLKSFGDDINKAKASGRERARANMVEGIRVRIVSKTTDTQSMGAGGSQEEVSSQSSSSADLELEGIQYKYLDEYPKEGQLTVLAFLSKEEYQRQSDKRLLGYRPERALRLWAGVIEPGSINSLVETNSGPPAGVNIQMKPLANTSTVALGADFYWKWLFFGAGLINSTKGVVLYEPKLARWEDRSNPMSIALVRLGAEWTPWAKRLQVSIPVYGEYANLNWDPLFSQAYGVAGGVNIRYWATDRVAFDVAPRWHLGLSESDIVDRSGVAQETKPGTRAKFGLGGPELTAAVIWNGF